MFGRDHSGMSQAIGVVVVDGSRFMNRLLMSHLGIAPDLRVVGTAFSGTRALELVRTLRPDVVMLDLDTPKLDGLEVLDHIMHECPTPVVLVSGVSPVPSTFTR